MSQCFIYMKEIEYVILISRIIEKCIPRHKIYIHLDSTKYISSVYHLEAVCSSGLIYSMEAYSYGMIIKREGSTFSSYWQQPLALVRIPHPDLVLS